MSFPYSFSLSPPLQINCWQNHFGTHAPWVQVTALILPALVSAAQHLWPLVRGPAAALEDTQWIRYSGQGSEQTGPWGELQGFAELVGRGQAARVSCNS